MLPRRGEEGVVGGVCCLVHVVFSGLMCTVAGYLWIFFSDVCLAVEWIHGLFGLHVLLFIQASGEMSENKKATGTHDVCTYAHV